MRHKRVDEYASNDADLVHGEAEDGRMVHISAVPSGLACKCRCPSCHAVLVARKGKVLAHCFAHYSGTACASAGETALHRLAKEIIERELRVHLPKLTIAVDDKIITVHGGGEHRFDRAIPERAHKDIIPDVMVWHGDRMLCIEIYVTHACGSEKRDFFRTENLAALEIDLSSFPRQSTPDAVELAVLKTAARSWIFNPVQERKEREMVRIR